MKTDPIKIVISVSGGVVQEVYADTKLVTVDVLDYDDYKMETRKNMQKFFTALEKSCSKLHKVY